MLKNKYLITIAVLSLFLPLLGLNTVSSSLQNIAEAFPQISYTNILLIFTLPALFVIPFSILSGILAGSKVKYRTLVIVGLLLFIFGGTAPVWINSFSAILISRIVFGIGLGIMTPLGNAYILHLFDGQQKANMLGVGAIVMNIGSIVLQLLGGYLCLIDWHYVFIPHVLGVFSLLVMLFFLPEPHMLRSESALRDNETDGVEKNCNRLPITVYIQCVLYGLGVMCVNPTVTKMSAIIQTAGIGNAASVGIVLSAMTVGAMLAGALFGKVYQKTMRFTIPIGLLTSAVGMGCIHYGNNLILLFIGSLLSGLGFNLIMPAIMMTWGTSVAPSKSAAAVGALMALMNFGIFISPYYMAVLTQFTGNMSPRVPVFAGMLVCLISAVTITLIRLKAPLFVEASEVS